MVHQKKDGIKILREKMINDVIKKEEKDKRKNVDA